MIEHGYHTFHSCIDLRAGICRLQTRWVYLDGKSSFYSVSLQVDLHWSRFSTCCDQFVPQLFQSIAAVGDQLPDEHLAGRGTAREISHRDAVAAQKQMSSPSYLLLRVQGPGDDVEKFFCFSLELVFGETTWKDQKNIGIKIT